MSKPDNFIMDNMPLKMDKAMPYETQTTISPKHNENLLN